MLTNKGDARFLEYLSAARDGAHRENKQYSCLLEKEMSLFMTIDFCTFFFKINRFPKQIINYRNVGDGNSLEVSLEVI